MHSSISVSQVFAVITYCCGGLIFGLSFGWSSPAIPILLENGEFPFSINDAAWSVSMMSLGSFFSLIPAGMIRNKFGTKMATFLFAIPSIVGWLLLIFSVNAWMIIVGRFLTGVTSGSYCFLVPIYVGEIASKEIRGTFLVIFDLAVKAGILTSYALPSIINFKLANATFLAILIAYVLASFCLPESPVYLVKKKKFEEALSSLKKLRNSRHKVEEEFNEIQAQEQTAKLSFMNEMRNKATRKAFFIVICIYVLFQLTGDNALLFYLTTIFIESGVSLDPFLSTIILGIVQFCAVFVSVVLIDRAGRKFLLILSFGTMCIALLALAGFFHAKSLDLNLENFQLVPVISLCTFAIGFSVGLGSVPFVLVGELFSISAKSFIAPLAQNTNFLMSFLVTLTFPIIAEYVGMFILFYAFGICCFIGVVYTWVVVPETKGKSLSEIQQKLSR